MKTKVVLVTGASSGIGEATALRLKALGYTVYAAARRLDRMAALAEAGIHTMKMDVTEEASVVEGVQRIITESGRIDVLVNNAGYGSYGALEDVPISEAKYQFEVNVFGLARLTQLVLPHMRSRHGGRIVNVSSMGGKIYEPMGAWYHASKFALEGLSDSPRLELKPFGIKVVVIEPGAIRTEWSGIAADNLLKVSGGTAYAKQAKAGAAVLQSGAANPRLTSPPSVIANAIAKAVTARRPKIRYVAGRWARPLLTARRILPDRAFDAVMGLVVRFGQDTASAVPALMTTLTGTPRAAIS